MSNNGYPAQADRLSRVLTAVLGLVLPSSGAVSPAIRLWQTTGQRSPVQEHYILAYRE